jgi:hypothetical protein
VKVVVRGTCVAGWVICGAALALGAMGVTVEAVVDAGIGAEAAAATRLILPGDMLGSRSHGGPIWRLVFEIRTWT